MTDTHAVVVGVLFITVVIHAGLAYLVGLISRHIRRAERRRPVQKLGSTQAPYSSPAGQRPGSR